MQRQEIIKTLKFLGWIALVFLIIGLLVAAAKRKDVERTKSVDVTIQALPNGENLITQGDVFELLDKSFGYALDGLRHSEVNVERIERILKSYPFVKTANAFIDAENIVKIDIQQRVPVLRIIDKMGVSYYFDEGGEKLPMSKNYTARVLIATGNIPPYVPDFKDREEHTLNHIYDLGQKVLANPFLWNMVEQIYVNNRNEYTLIPKLGNQKILLGKYDEMDNKLENLEIFYKNAIATKGWRIYKTIDLRYDGQVVGVK